METEEIWRPVADHENRYEVSDRGRIRVIGTDATGRQRYIGHILSPALRKGYLGVTLWTGGKRKNIGVHVVVARAFLGEKPPGFQCNHKDGNKQNPLLENLEYTSAADNHKHALDVLGHQPPYGATHWAATVSDAEIKKMRERHVAGEGVTAIALSMSKAPSWVCKVCRGHIRWSAGGPLPDGLALRQARTRVHAQVR